MTKKIFDSDKCIQQLVGWNSVLRGTKFSIHKAYLKLLGDRDKPGWQDIVCRNKATMKCVFMVWMLAKMRLSTLDMLLKWGLQVHPHCKL